MMNAVPGMQGRFVHPDAVTTHFHVREGDSVADFGAGRGFFIPLLAELVGPEGHVYACEIQKGLVEYVGEMIRTQSLENSEVLWCDLEMMGGSKLTDQSIDIGLLVNTLFQLEDRTAAIKEIARTMRPGGKLFVIDWTESFSGLGPQPEQIIDAVAAQDLCESHGFLFERNYEAGDHHYGLAFRRV